LLKYAGIAVLAASLGNMYVDHRRDVPGDGIEEDNTLVSRVLGIDRTAPCDNHIGDHVGQWVCGYPSAVTHADGTYGEPETLREQIGVYWPGTAEWMLGAYLTVEGCKKRRLPK